MMHPLPHIKRIGLATAIFILAGSVDFLVNRISGVDEMYGAWIIIVDLHMVYQP
ncbi:hypothetical protein SAMN05192540_3941 [Maribacter dokdonensis]|uniref:Uncharacterized protein n=1 Tax=Maribacter dokdonensis TaxID=320912 RepID=A0A1H4UXG6_9FLAO|nr:hypothetical protein SAMN05192540_3941 [Maribacter dokdonensis]